MNGVASVQTNAAADARYQLLTVNDGRFYFNLLAGNAQVIGTSQMYASESARATGIASVKANGPSDDVRKVQPGTMARPRSAFERGYFARRARDGGGRCWAA